MLGVNKPTPADQAANKAMSVMRNVPFTVLTFWTGRVNLAGQPRRGKAWRRNSDLLG